MGTLGQNVNEIAELNACRLPSWLPKVTPDIDGAPSTADAGVALAPTITNGTTAARVAVKLREDVYRRTARVTVTTRDAAANYTVTVNGTAIATTSGSFATDDSVLVELKAKIDADTTVGQAVAPPGSPVIDSYLIDSSGDVTLGTVAGGNAAVALVIIGEADTDYSIAVSAGGTGVLACKADPLTATAYIWLTAGGRGEDGTSDKPGDVDWCLADDGAKSVTRRGLAINLNVGGWARLYVELGSVAGHGSDGGTVTYTDANSPVVWVGPAARETS